MRINKKIILLLVLIVLSLNLTACLDNHDSEEIRKRMKEHLYEKYGEEFVVGNIGTRKFGDTEFYQAQIYPKSIIGTPKEGDSYYYADAKIDKLSFGRLREPGDTYGRVIVRERAEKYLISKVKDIFGERVKLKPKISYYTCNKYDAMVGYLTPDFEGALEKCINDPENNRLELDLDVYVFDKIEDKAEKEERRQQIFEFVQYLKDEGLFDYLELGVVFIDERVLAPSYNDFEWDIRYADKVKKEIEGETVRMPPMDLREKMSKQLQEEVNKMSKEELLASMRSIRKSELTYDGIEKYNMSHFSEVYSPKMLKERYSTSLERNPEMKRDFKHIKDVSIPQGLRYIYK